jgi:hypothetical protein
MRNILLPPIKFAGLVHGLFGLVLLSVMAPASSQKAPSESLFDYKIPPGDQLSNLVVFLLKLPNDANSALLHLKQINPDVDLLQLKTGQTVQVPLAWLRSQSQSAKVSQVLCKGAFWPDTTHPVSKALQVGDGVGEGAVLRVPAGCQLTLSMPDGSRVHLPSGASVKIERLRIPNVSGLPQVRFKLLQGRMGVDVLKKRPSGSNFEVQTPQAIAGVRGTQFRVGFDDTQISRFEVIEGEVQQQGLNDNTTSQLQTGIGQWVDARGTSAMPTALPAAPQFQQFLPQNPSGSGNLLFAQEPKAVAYSWRQNPSVNHFSMNGELSAQPLKLPTRMLSTMAQVWFVSSIDSAGLQGLEHTYAMCHESAGIQGGFCSAAFDTSFFNGRPMRLTLSLENRGASNTTDMRFFVTAPDNGTLWVGGLKPGAYRYHLSHLPEHGESGNPEHWVSQTGQFQLVNVYTGKP